jgi:hypothetical protein
VWGDVEGATVGQFPDSAAWDPDSCTSHVADDTVAHTGLRSLRGGAEQYPHAWRTRTSWLTPTSMWRTWILLGAPSSESVM